MSPVTRVEESAGSATVPSCADVQWTRARAFGRWEWVVHAADYDRAVAAAAALEVRLLAAAGENAALTQELAATRAQLAGQ